MTEVPTRLFWVERGESGARLVAPEELGDYLGRDDGWVWLDIPELDAATGTWLGERLGVHPRAVDDALARNHIARVHHYRDSLFMALHRPLSGASGHVHYLELDLFVGPGYLVTTHGPRNPVVPLTELLVETNDVADRLLAGRLVPESPVALTYALVAAITNAQERLVNHYAREVGLLEQRVMTERDQEHPQAFLDELFTTRHTLLTVRTMALQGSEVMTRARRLMAGDLSPGDHDLILDMEDQYHRLAGITSAQLEFLHGVTDFYRARNDTRMTIAGERLAVIAAITLPVTAISSVMGMNVIVNDSTHWPWVVALVALMGALSVWLLVWARRQGWW